MARELLLSQRHPLELWPGQARPAAHPGFQDRRSQLVRNGGPPPRPGSGDVRFDVGYQLRQGLCPREDVQGPCSRLAAAQGVHRRLLVCQYGPGGEAHQQALVPQEESHWDCMCYFPPVQDDIRPDPQVGVLHPILCLEVLICVFVEVRYLGDV